jgi:hypothetical protein
VSLKAVTNQPVQLYAAPAYAGQDGIPIRITNLDSTSTIYVDTDIPVNAGSTPLPPQASIVYDGSADVWASTAVAGLVVLVDAAPRSTYYENPVGVQIALNALGLATAAGQTNQNTAIPNGIAATGVPLLNGIALRTFQANVNVAAGANTSFTMPMSFLSYQLVFYVSVQAGVIATPVNIQLQWTKSGLRVRTDSFWVFAGDSTHLHALTGQGPNESDSLTVFISAPNAAADAITFDLVVLDKTSPESRHLWQTDDTAAFSIAGYTTPFTDMAANVVWSSSGLVVTGGSLTRLLPLYSGECWLRLHTTSNAADCGITINMDAEFKGGAAPPTGNIFNGKTSATGDIDQLMVLPRVQCSIFINNTNAGSQTLSGTLIAAELTT